MTATDTDANDGDRAGRTITESSRIVSLVRAFGDWVRGSFLYRWLTKEPEPEVIVIDLRETVTVGPVIRLLDRVIERVTPWWRASGVRRFSLWAVQRTADRPVRVLGVLAMTVAAVGFVLMAARGTLSIGTLIVTLGLLVGGALATRSQHSWADVQDTRGYQLLVAALEPPDPPEGAESDASSPEGDAVDATEVDGDNDTQS